MGADQISDNTNPATEKIHSLEVRVPDHVSAILAYWDKNLICRFANNAYREWFGRDKEDMINKITIKELLGPLYEKNLPYIKEALAGNAQTFEREITLPTGEVRYSIANFFPDIENGQVTGFFVHSADVSAMKKLELELKAKEKDLIKSLEIISEQNKRLINFAYLVSHNFKSYAANIDAILDLLIDAETEETKNEMINHLKNISASFNKTISNLTEIIDVTTKQNVEKEKINLHAYIEKAIDTLSHNIKTAKAVIYNKVEEKIQLLFSPAYMESILLNFITNAIKYRHPTRQPVIAFNAFEKDGYLVLQIKDNGRGLDLKKYGDNLFGLYKTFHGNADAKGVGLFITKYQVEVMGGYIEVESEVNTGTTFSIYFKWNGNKI